MKKALLVSLMVSTLGCAGVFAAAPRQPSQTVITGDKMQIIKNGEQVVFTGNARVMRGPNIGAIHSERTSPSPCSPE